MGHGSRVTTRVASVRRQLPRARAASDSARTSAWAVGSCRRSRSLWRRATTSPPWTTTAPMGTSPCSTAARASSRARPMSSTSVNTGHKVARSGRDPAAHDESLNSERELSGGAGAVRRHSLSRRGVMARADTGGARRRRRLRLVAGVSFALVILLTSDQRGLFAVAAVASPDGSHLPLETPTTAATATAREGRSLAGGFEALAARLRLDDGLLGAPVAEEAPVLAEPAPAAPAARRPAPAGDLAIAPPPPAFHGEVAAPPPPAQLPPSRYDSRT